jgi:hypothetical protein
MIELITNLDQVMDTLDLDPARLAAMQRIMEDLQYPVAPDGTVMEVGYVSPTAAYHLARCGYDRVNEPLIKKRPVSGPGIVMGACHWVSLDEADSPVVFSSPLDDLENMTIAQVNALPEPTRSQARERLGLPHDKPGWNQKPKVNIEDAPDSDDGPDWTTK